MKNSPMFLIIILSFLTTYTFAGPVSHFGMLKVCGKDICGEKTGQSTPISFKGPSLGWSTGTTSTFYSPEVVDWFVDNMQIGIIRAAMGIRYLKENSNPINVNGTTPVGYYDDPATQKAIMKVVIDAAIFNDIYVIVDWHSHNAESETSSAKSFFTEMANAYQNIPNIIWEVYNEPVGSQNNPGSKPSQITSHANEIITALRNAGNNNLVLVGSRYYSQNPSEQASNYGSTAESKNVAFTFHFYAATHFTGGGIQSSANSARSNGYAVFASEWGTVNADGNGSMSTSSSDNWTSWMDANKISNCMWQASAQNEDSAIFSTGTTPLTLATNRLTSNGQYFQTYMNSNKWTAQIPSGNPKAGDFTASVKDGESVTIASTTLGIDGTIEPTISPPKDVSGAVYGTAEVSGTGIKYTTNPSGSPEKVRFTYTVKKDSKTTQGRVAVNITDLKPKLPAVDPISVSRRAPTKLSLVNSLKATAPKNDKFTLTAVTISDASKGSVSKIAASTSTGDTILFTPSAAMANKNSEEVSVSYTVKNNANVTSTANVTLYIQNQAPTMQSSTAYCTATIEQDTEETRLSIASHFGGRDKDGDSIYFSVFYLAPEYPGELTKLKGDTLLYKRKGNTNQGKVVLLAVATDGALESNLGKVCITLKGSGATINVTAPTEIPGYVPIIPQLSNAGNLSIKFFGKSIEIYFAKSGFAKLDVYSLSGKNMGSLLNGHQNAGSREVSLKNLNLQKGVYILRLSQGSQVKTLRIVN